MALILRHYGKLISITTFLLVIIINAISGTNISYFKVDNSIYFLYLSLLIITYFGIIFLSKLNTRFPFQISFPFISWASQALSISFLVRLIENQEFSSLKEKNDALGVSWVIILPVTFFIILFLGILFDIGLNQKKH